MGHTNEIFAHVLTNDRFFYNEKWVNLIDLYVLYQNHFNMLVKPELFMMSRSCP